MINPLTYKQTILDRLLDRTRTNEVGCIIYLGPEDKDGYCRLTYYDKYIRVNRLIMHLKLGFDLESKEYILHRNECSSRRCINTDHLYIGTQHQNIQDQVRKGTHSNQYKNQTHCKNGHELTEDNIYVDSYKARKCRTCRRQYQRNYKARKGN